MTSYYITHKTDTDILYNYITHKTDTDILYN